MMMRMTRMQAWAAPVVLALAGWFSPALAADVEPDAAVKAVADQYYLDAGRDVGSMLRLHDDGGFEWRWVSNVDKHAEGSWKFDGETIVLQAYTPGKPTFSLFRDEELARAKPAEAGTWLAIVGLPGKGPMADVEVQFEARSGKTVTQVTLPNGDAQVDMPATEVWARAGLRRKGTSEAWQWFDIPPQRAEARLAGFSVDNIAQLGRAPFQQMRLVRQGRNLAVIRIDDKVLDPASSDTRMVYLPRWK